MQVTQKIVVPAKDINLMTQYELRLALGQSSSSDETLEDMIEMLLEWQSDEIATVCGRSFAKETLVETFREINSDCKRLFLSHYPLDVVDSVVANGITLVENTDYEVDYENGKITRLGAIWADPSIVTYTGGYDLPHETPPALKQAATLMTREAYFAATRGDASVRMVSHKGSRVMYFDPNAKSASASSGSSAARRSIESLLQSYIRIEV